MMPWLREHLESARVWAWAVLLAPSWEWVQVHWGGFWWSSPLIWICLFWAADWVLGSARALHDGYTHPADPTRGWRARRAAQSVGKLAIWVAVLMVAWGLRDSAGTGGKVAASLFELGVLLTEAGSVIGHLGEITGSPLLRGFAARSREMVGNRKENENA